MSNTSTTEKLFFRVNDTWERILDRSPDSKFAVNLSGDTIHFMLTPNDYLTASQTLHPHALGGSISQLRIPPDTALYAKAARTGTDGIIIVDTGRIVDSHTEDLRTLIDHLTGSVMRLEHKVSEANIEYIDHKAKNTLLARRFIASEISTQSDISHLSRMAITQLERLFAAEILLYRVRNTTHRIDYEIKHDYRYSSIAKDMLKLAVKVDEVLARTDLVDSQLEELYEIGSYEGLDKLSSSMDSINNTLVTIGNKYTSEEMAEAWTTILDDVPDGMREPLTVIKDMLIDIKDNRTLITANQTNIETIQTDYPPKHPASVYEMSKKED